MGFERGEIEGGGGIVGGDECLDYVRDGQGVGGGGGGERGGDGWRRRLGVGFGLGMDFDDAGVVVRGFVFIGSHNSVV